MGRGAGAGMWAAHNATRSTVLMARGRVADRLWARVRGLMGARPLEAGQGLWITPCNGIHTFWMGFPLDVVFLNRQMEVVAVQEAMPPWRVGRIVRGASSVLELPSGAIAATGTEPGDRIELSSVLA